MTVTMFTIVFGIVYNNGSNNMLQLIEWDVIYHHEKHKSTVLLKIQSVITLCYVMLCCHISTETSDVDVHRRTIVGKSLLSLTSTNMYTDCQRLWWRVPTCRGWKTWRLVFKSTRHVTDFVMTIFSIKEYPQGLRTTQINVYSCGKKIKKN